MIQFREFRTIAPRRPIASAAVKRINWLTFMKSSLFSFFRSTQTHGYKFLVVPHRPKYETVFWILILSTISILTIFMILYAYLPMLNKPTITTQMPFQKSVKNVPFPTVAFCSQNRISREALMNYSNFM